jgi:pantothenate kinase
MSEQITEMNMLVQEAARMLTSSQRSILGIAGPPGAGKTTLAKAIFEQLSNLPEYHNEVVLLPMDGFHLPNTILEKKSIKDIKGAPETFDTQAYIELLQNVKDRPEKTWYAPGFDRTKDDVVPKMYTISPSVKLIITEGNYLLMPGPWKPIKMLCDSTWFLDIDPKIERKRLINRHIEENMRSPGSASEWVDRSDLKNAELVRSQSTKADQYIIVPENFRY